MNNKNVKVRFFEKKFRTYLHPSDPEYEDFDSDDEECSPFPLIKAFMEERNWILEGNMKDLEEELEEALGGSMFTECGWYQDNWIIRHINGGYGEYLSEKK